MAETLLYLIWIELMQTWDVIGEEVLTMDEFREAKKRFKESDRWQIRE